MLARAIDTDVEEQEVALSSSLSCTHPVLVEELGQRERGELVQQHFAQLQLFGQGSAERESVGILDGLHRFLDATP